MNIQLKQQTRVILLFVDIGLLAFASLLAFGTWTPPTGNEGFWFYTALLSLLLGSRLVTPYYHKPVDVIAYAVSALIALFLANDWPRWGMEERIPYTIVLAYCGLVAAASFIQIFTKDSARQSVQRFSNNMRVAADAFGV